MLTVNPGLAGVVAFDTEIAEPDRDGGALRYRGIDIQSLATHVSYGDVWGLLTYGDFDHPLPGTGPVTPDTASATSLSPDTASVAGLPPDTGTLTLPVRTGDIRVDVQAAVTALAAQWRLGQLIDIDERQARDDLARTSAAVFSYVAQAARGGDRPAVPQRLVDAGRSVAEQFMIRWQGEADPRRVVALDRYWICAAEHGMNASTFTARVVASTGADAPACLSAAMAALSGPLHGGAPARALGMIEAVEGGADARAHVRQVLDGGQRLMGFGHAIYRAEDPRARILRQTAREIGAPRYEAARELEVAALAELRERKPDRVLETNVEFWAAVVLDFAGIPAEMLTAVFACARTAGWSAHILEQKRLGKIIRPSADYVGPGAREADQVRGWTDALARNS